MRLGFAVPVSGSWATPEAQRDLAQQAEELGYHSLWTFQRLLYPDDPARSPTPQRWSPVYRSVSDPLVVLSFLVGNHEGRVEDLWLVGIALVIVLILLWDIRRRKNAWRSR